MTHSFTEIILAILAQYFGDSNSIIFENSPLLQYINVKTKSANRGSKSRGAFANHYALYVLVEDYIHKGFLAERSGEYINYEGARYTDLLRRQRELPFGAKLQNHALNSRLNDEFSKYFPTLDLELILRDQTEQRYWINEQLLNVKIVKDNNEVIINVAQPIIEIIDAYIETKRSNFAEFLNACKQIAKLSETDRKTAIEFIKSQLEPNVDARIFEIISFAILKAHYGEQMIFWGWSLDTIQQESLALYKTGRTNANDGGIDFVMKPLGRFFQVTETIDVHKYFLDIDKLQRFPLTFVVKTTDDPAKVIEQIREQAQRKYGVNAIVERYMKSVEEIITINQITELLENLITIGQLETIMQEIIFQGRIEFNYDENEESILEDTEEE